MIDFETLSQQPAYKYFREAFSQRKLPLVIVCGAGMSVAAGLPTWRDLRAKLEQDAQSKINAIGPTQDHKTTSRLAAARRNPDLWLAFQALRDILGEANFRNAIVSALTPAESAKPPREYELLLQLAPRGVVTLNLDKFLGETLQRTLPDRLINRIYGFELAKRWDSIAFGPNYFVQLHGDINNSETWVLTQSDLTRLTSSEGHRQFLTKLYTENLVLFVGLSLEDAALSTRLLTLRENGFKPPALYWLTARRDQSTIKWADENDISSIFYTASGAGEHFAALEQIVADLRRFVPEDPAPPPVVLTEQFFDTESDDLDPEALANKEPEFIRTTLCNILQTKLNSTPQEDHYDIFENICQKYDYAITRAFFRSEKPKFKSWFGYELSFPSLGKGNFGEVYRATRPETGEEEYAIKILNHNIVNDKKMLIGFRRGVRSMLILSQYNIEGVANIKMSYELPPTIVMNHISGVTLQDAIVSTPKLSWISRLSIVCSTAEIVFRGHSLLQTIMHRDLKPSNIMIRNFDYSENQVPDVIVLDFDMSWHKDADLEKDVDFESRDDFGYLAPEQTNWIKTVSARHTRVDSYGLGMTIFYTFGGVHPLPNEGLSDGWAARALAATRNAYAGSWVSAPARLARVITRCTAMEQSDRLDFADARRALIAIRDAVTNPSAMRNPELWAEEILASIPSAVQYEWDSGRLSGAFELQRGIKLSASPDLTKGAVRIVMEFINQGGQQYTKLTQRIEAVAQDVPKILKEAGWSKVELSRAAYQIRIQFVASVEDAMRAKRTLIEGLSIAYKQFEKLGGVW